MSGQVVQTAAKANKYNAQRALERMIAISPRHSTQTKGCANVDHGEARLSWRLMLASRVLST